MKGQSVLIEYVLTILLVVAAVVAAHYWAGPLLERVTGTADLNKAGAELRSLNAEMVEVAHQPGARRQIDLDMGKGLLSIDAEHDMLVYSIGEGEAETQLSSELVSDGKAKLCLEEYDVSVSDKVSFAGREYTAGDVAKVSGAYIYISEISASQIKFYCLPDERPTRRVVKKAGGYETFLYLPFDFDIEGSGGRQGKARLFVSNDDGVVKVGF